MHCFGGSVETAKQCIDMNFMITLGDQLHLKMQKNQKK